MSATAVAEVRVHVSVDVRVRHLGCFWRTLIVWWRLISILLKKNCGVFFVLSFLFSLRLIIPSLHEVAAPAPSMGELQKVIAIDQGCKSLVGQSKFGTDYQRICLA